MSSPAGFPLLGATLLVLIQVAAGSVHGRARTRPSWLSAASGISVTYVFLHLLPALARTQERWLAAEAHRPWKWFEGHVYLAALLGVVLSLGLDRLTAGAKERRERFWLHVGAFVLYNLLIGGLTLRLTGPVATMLAVVAFGAHMLVNDHNLQSQYGASYTRVGRWLLSAAILLGWVLAVVLDTPVIVVAVIVGLVSGAMILNVIKDELPGEGEGEYTALVLGVVCYVALLLALDYTMHIE